MVRNKTKLNSKDTNFFFIKNFNFFIKFFFLNYNAHLKPRKKIR